MKLKFVNLEKYDFVLEPRYYFYGWSKSGKILARESVAKKLVESKTYLPKDYNFKIWDCRRTRAVQLEMIESFRRRFRYLHPGLSKKHLEEMVWHFAAKPLIKIEKLDTHRNGGSVDLTIVNQRGEELYMGTEFDELSKKAATDYFEKKKNLTLLEKEAQKNRKLLIEVMTKAEFVNYANEWWHWSYDK